MAFTIGKALLIAPPPHPESPQSYDVCLPAGGWYDLWTGKAVTARSGSTGAVDTVRETPSLDHLPVYVRAGTILPTQLLVQSTAETPAGPLTLDVYPGADCGGSIYLDDGHSLAFRRGAYLRQSFRCTVSAPDRLHVEIGKREGSYAPWWRAIMVVVHDAPANAVARMDGKVIDAHDDPQTRNLRFSVPANSTGTAIEIGPL